MSQNSDHYSSNNPTTRRRSSQQYLPSSSDFNGQPDDSSPATHSYTVSIEDGERERKCLREEKERGICTIQLFGLLFLRSTLEKKQLKESNKEQCVSNPSPSLSSIPVCFFLVTYCE